MIINSNNLFYVDDNVYNTFTISEKLKMYISNKPKVLKRFNNRLYDKVYESLSPIIDIGITYDFIFCFGIFFNLDYNALYTNIGNSICRMKISNSYCIKNDNSYIYLPYLYIEYTNENKKIVNIRAHLDKNNIIINLLDLSNNTAISHSMTYRTDQYRLEIELSSLREVDIKKEFLNIPDNIIRSLSQYELTIYELKDIICYMIYLYMANYIKGNITNENAGMKNFDKISKQTVLIFKEPYNALNNINIHYDSI